MVQRSAGTRRVPSALAGVRDRVLTVAAVATVLASIFGIGPFEGPGAARTDGGDAFVHTAALR